MLLLKQEACQRSAALWQVILLAEVPTLIVPCGAVEYGTGFALGFAGIEDFLTVNSIALRFRTNSSPQVRSHHGYGRVLTRPGPIRLKHAQGDSFM